MELKPENLMKILNKYEKVSHEITEDVRYKCGIAKKGNGAEIQLLCEQQTTIRNILRLHVENMFVRNMKLINAAEVYISNKSADDEVSGILQYAETRRRILDDMERGEVHDVVVKEPEKSKDGTWVVSAQSDTIVTITKYVDNVAEETEIQ